MSDFKKNTTTMASYTIECNKGLWSVEGPKYTDVLAEAQHYYRQYAEDGEYDGTAKEKFIQRLREERNKSTMNK